MDIRFIKFTQVKTKGIFYMDIRFINFTQVKNKGIFYMDIRFKRSKHGGRRSIARIKESFEVLKKKIIIFYREIPLQFFQKKKKPEILPQIYREIPLQNFYKEKSL